MPINHAPSRILQYFQYDHLPPSLQGASKPICDLAMAIDASLPHSPEKTAGLRKLLEAKDCLVRAHLDAIQRTSHGKE